MKLKIILEKSLVASCKNDVTFEVSSENQN